MDYELMFPSKYLKSCDLKKDGRTRDVTVSIVRIDLEDLPLRGTSKTKLRGVLTVAHRGRELDKQVVLNRTNADTIAKLYGRDTDQWIDKPITLYPTRVQFGRETVDAIRIRDKRPAPSQPRARDPEPDPDIELADHAAEHDDALAGVA